MVLEPVAMFEFGVAVEVFGIDRRDDGIEPFDFRVVGLNPGQPLASKNFDPFTITPQLGFDAIAGQRPRHRRGDPAPCGRGLPARGAGSAARSPRRGCHRAQPLLGLLRPRRRRPAGRASLHHALDVRRGDAAALPRRPSSTRGSSSSRTTVSSPAPAPLPASTPACTWCARNWALRSPPGSPAAWSCRRSGTAASCSTSRHRFPSAPPTASAPILAWAVENIDEPHTVSTLADAGTDERAHLRPPVRWQRPAPRRTSG